MDVIEYQPQVQEPVSLRKHYLLLVLVILLGAGLRFFKLDQPAIWGDEALTYSRICGSYQDLIDVLQFDGFVPLHYELYQWIAAGMPMRGKIEQEATHPNITALRIFSRGSREATSQPATKRVLVGEHPLVPDGVKMTPIVMRLVPAIAGTLEVAAIYFLAVQIASRRVALTTALITACSAYLLNYSRDAKMYMHFWLFCTLSVACLLWWLRARSRISWLCWVAASLAMCGLHAGGGVVLGVELIIFLSRDRQWWMPGIIFLIGFFAIGLLGGQTTFFRSQFDDRWLAAGAALVIGIVVYLMQRRRRWGVAIFFVLGMCVILSGVGGYYLNFNRFKQDIDEGDWRRDSRIGWVEEYNRGRDNGDLVGYAATSFLLSWEWTMPHEEQFVEPRVLKMLHGATYGILGVLGVGLVCWSVRRRSSTDAGASVGRGMLWVVGWIVVPAYAFYCISTAPVSRLAKGTYTAGFDSPTQLFLELWKMVDPGPRLEVVGLGLLLLGWMALMWRAGKLLGVAGAMLVVYALGSGVYFLLGSLNRQGMEAGQMWHSIWIPRYMGFIWPAIGIAVAAMLSAIPTRPLRYGAIGFFIAVNLVGFWARVYHSEPPTDLLCADTYASQPLAATTRTYTSVRFFSGLGVAPGEGLYMSNAWKYYMAILSGMKITPIEFRMPGSAKFLLSVRTWRNFMPSQIAFDLRASPKVDHVVVWDEVPVNSPDVNQTDLLKPQLGGNWRRISEQVFPSFDHWTWQKLYDARRREYVRVK